MYYIQNNILSPSYNKFNDINEPFNQPRQILPITYLHNGCIDIVKTDTIINYNSMTGRNILPYIMDKDETNDIDTLEEFEKSSKSVV
jgi:CMP-N-acetylneuraminic acid synthetase